MRTTAVQSVACGRPSRPAPGRGYVSSPRAAFLLLFFALFAALAGVGIGRARDLLGRHHELALHPERRVVADRADELVGPGGEGRLARLDLPGPEDRRDAEVG